MQKDTPAKQIEAEGKRVLATIARLVESYESLTRQKVKAARGGLPRLAYNLQETAKVLGLSQTSVYRLIERGKLRCCPELRHKVIPLTSIEEFLNPKAE